jgi:glutaredoxin-dependent peroxiredoxin
MEAIPVKINYIKPDQHKSKLIMSIQIGQTAPEFTLFDSAKNKVNLSDLKGKNVLILFFPQAFTGVCTKELCAVRDDISRYNNVHAQVIGISVDSVFTLAKFKEDQQYNFTLLSDFNKEVSALYGTLYTDWILDMKGVSKRSAFLIDKAGIICYAEVLESAGDMPDFKAINEILDNLNA